MGPFSIKRLSLSADAHKGSDVLLERAAKKLGLTAYPAPVAILSKPHNGRPSCINCGWCNGLAASRRKVFFNGSNDSARVGDR